MQTTKQKVFIVLVYDGDGKCRVDNVYPDEIAASVHAERVEKKLVHKASSVHVIEKSVNGTESFGDLVFISGGN